MTIAPRNFCPSNQRFRSDTYANPRANLGHSIEVGDNLSSFSACQI